MPPRRIVLEDTDDPLLRPSLKPGQRVIIRSRADDSITGYAEIVEAEGNSSYAVAEVILHERSALVAPGDSIHVVDLTSEVKDFPGRGDLLLHGDKDRSARFKRLAWFGPFLGDGHSLSSGETLIDLSSLVAHGITDRFTLGTIALANLVAPNLVAKYTLVQNNIFSFTPSIATWYSPSQHTGAIQVRSLFSTSVNTKLTSHTAISFVNGTNNAFLRTELQSGFEYLLDSWDRLLFGPSYDFSLAAVGGYISYLFVWDHFHALIGLQTHNLSDLTFDPTRAYTITFAGFWRF